MALVNPNIAMSFRQPDIQAPNALAQFAQIQQIQGGRQAQELAQYQLGAAQRGEAREVARINALAGAGTDETAVANALLRSGDIAGYSAFVKAAEDRRTQKLTQQKTEGEIAGQPLARQKTQGDIDAQQIVAAKGRADAFSTALAPLVGAVQAKKPITHQDVFAQANRLVSQGLLRKEDLYSIPINVAELPNFVMNMASSTENSRKALETYLPKALVAGGDVINVNPLAEGGVGKPLARVSISDYQNAQNQIAQEQLGVAQRNAATSAGQLKVARDRLAQEGQGVTYQQDAQGNIVALPSRLAAGGVPTARPVTSQDGAPVKGKPSAFAEKAAAQRVQMGKDLNFAIKELGDITKDGGLIDQSTGSGAGRLADIGMSFIGQATPGAIAIGKIEPVADLALKMIPRFEGPQSDKDTASYKAAAGQLADPTLPTKIRKEAGKTVLRLMQERKSQFATSDMAAEGTAPTQDVRSQADAILRGGN